MRILLIALLLSVLGLLLTSQISCAGLDWDEFGAAAGGCEFYDWGDKFGIECEDCHG